MTMDYVKVTLEGDELVAVLPDGSTLAHADAVRLAELLQMEGVSADQVLMPDWREGDSAPINGQKIALLARMRRGYAYSITSRPDALGGGWRLRLLDDGEEVGGGVFPPVEGIDDAEEALQAAHEAAMDNALDWMNSHAPGGYTAVWPSTNL
jgi:hypothetical protein